MDLFLRMNTVFEFLSSKNLWNAVYKVASSMANRFQKNVI